MTNTKKGFDIRERLKFLVEGNIIPEDVLPKFDVVVERDDVIEAIEKGSDLVYDFLDDSLYYVMEDGTKVN